MAVEVTETMLNAHYFNKPLCDVINNFELYMEKTINRTTFKGPDAITELTLIIIQLIEGLLNSENKEQLSEDLKLLFAATCLWDWEKNDSIDKFIFIEGCSLARHEDIDYIPISDQVFYFVNHCGLLISFINSPDDDEHRTIIHLILKISMLICKWAGIDFEEMIKSIEPRMVFE